MISKKLFGTTADHAEVDLYTLRNRRGMEAQIMTYGGIVTALKVPDKNGALGDVVLGFNHLEGYLQRNPCFGALIGRYCNRIAHGRFSLDGVPCTLAINNGPNHLHGGLKGFDKVIWTAQPVDAANGPALQLTYLSKDGEEGYPGNLLVTAVYTVTEDNALTVDYVATTDKKTVCNLTHHSYFNLAGQGDVLGHVAQVNADKFTPVDAGLIPTGELRLVAGTPFDFRKPTPIGQRINDTRDEQIRLGHGYDHNFVLNKKANELSFLARVAEPVTGRIMEVWTTEPGSQFYSANFLDGTLTGKGGWIYRARNGFCFEPQHYPDSPNHPAFPTTELKPGETYRSTTHYRFSVQSV